MPSNPMKFVPSPTKERYEVAERRCRSFKEATERAVDLALNSRESMAIAIFEGKRLTGYINVTASLELP